MFWNLPPLWWAANMAMPGIEWRWVLPACLWISDFSERRQQNISKHGKYSMCTYMYLINHRTWRFYNQDDMGNQSSELERNQMGESPCASEINTAILWKCVAAKHCYQGTLPLKHYFQIDVSQKSHQSMSGVSELCACSVTAWTAWL